MVARSFKRPWVVLGIAVALAACGGTATPPPAGGGGSSPAAPSVAGSTASSAAGSIAPSAATGGANGYEGSFKTSGLYSATWTVAPDMHPYPFNSNENATVTSDKGTFGNIGVKPDGSLSFGSGGADFSGAYNGTGAKVTLDASGQWVCAFTVDTDLTGTNDKKILHISREHEGPLAAPGGRGADLPLGARRSAVIGPESRGPEDRPPGPDRVVVW